MFQARILVSKAMALCDGLKATKDARFKQIHIEGG